MIILDNFLPKEIEEEIKKLLYGNNFPWFFTPDVTNGVKGLQKRPCAYHRLYGNEKVNSHFYESIKNFVVDGSSKVSGIQYNHISNGRCFLQYPLNLQNYDLDNFHIDDSEPHMVFLYYVNDSDGDTIIVDKKFNGQKENVTLSENNIIARVTPKQGRIVIFNGAYYHTAEQPRHNMRCVINFNAK